jgi:hypothetical protein
VAGGIRINGRKRRRRGGIWLVRTGIEDWQGLLMERNRVFNRASGAFVDAVKFFRGGS